MGLSGAGLGLLGHQSRQAPSSAPPCHPPPVNQPQSGSLTCEAGALTPRRFCRREAKTHVPSQPVCLPPASTASPAQLRGLPWPLPLVGWSVDTMPPASPHRSDHRLGGRGRRPGKGREADRGPTASPSGSPAGRRLISQIRTCADWCGMRLCLGCAWALQSCSASTGPSLRAGC